MNARRIAAMLGKESREILRDPITLGVALAMPLIMLLLFGYAISLDVREAPLGVLDLDRSPLSRQLVRQFNLPVEIVAGETVREPDGLAMSSRNGYLSSQERAEAPRLARVLREVALGTASEAAMRELAQAGWKPDYVEVRRRSDLGLPQPQDSERVVLAAARLGTTRLIDNLEF